MDSTKQRVLFWDNFKGILIFLVVTAHILYEISGVRSGSGVLTSVLNMIYVFHMPAFIFTTGYLSTSEKAASKSSLIKLFALYLIFNFTIWFINPSGIPFTLITPHYSFWYLLAVIAWRIITPTLSKYKYILPISIAAALFSGFFADMANVLAISRIIAFYPFFLAGFLLNKSKLTKIIEAKKPRKNIIFTIIILITFTATLFYVTNYNINTDMLLMGKYDSPVDFLHRSAVYLLAAIIILSLVFIIPNKKIPLITRFGESSLSIFLLHRYPTFLGKYIPITLPVCVQLIISISGGILICTAFSLPIVSKIINSVGNYGAKLLTHGFDKTENKKQLIFKLAVIAGIIAILFAPVLLQIFQYIVNL